MSFIFCVLHGLTDSPLEDLEGLTPLQMASHPTLDYLAQQGNFLSLSPPVLGGLAGAFFALFGIDRDAEKVAQGPMEAYSLGYDLKPEQVAFSVRFVSTSGGLIVDVSDAVLNEGEGREMCRSLNEAAGSLGLQFLHVQGPQAVLIATHPALKKIASHQSATPVQTVGRFWLDLLGEGLEVRNLMGQVQRVMAGHEINHLHAELEEPLANGLILSHGGYALPASFWDSLNGVKETALGNSADIVWMTGSVLSMGIASLLGIEVIQLPKEQRKYERLSFIRRVLPELIQEKRAVVIEIDYLWDSTLHGELLNKIKGIEFLDKNLIRPLLELSQSSGCHLAVLPLKHSDIRTGQLMPGAVPAVVFPCAESGCGVVRFDEGPLSAIVSRPLYSHNLCKRDVGERTG